MIYKPGPCKPNLTEAVSCSQNLNLLPCYLLMNML